MTTRSLSPTFAMHDSREGGLTFVARHNDLNRKRTFWDTLISDDGIGICSDTPAPFWASD